MDNISQIAAVRFDPSTGTIIEQFTEYSLPTGPVSADASKVNGLFEVGGNLCKQSNGVMEQLSASPARLVFDKFARWVLNLQGGEELEPAQVICVGYNNSSFDDHCLLSNWRNKLDPELFIIVQRKFFTLHS